jgi:glutathione S-transferase
VLTLYVEELFDSPSVFTVYVALGEKRLPFVERVVEMAKGEHRRPPFSEQSPTARLPTLEHDGLWLAESLAIVEYLEERFPPPQHPAALPLGVADRARARMVMSWLRTSLAALTQERSTASVFLAPATAPLGPAARADAELLIVRAERWLPPGADWLFGDFTAADADLGLMLQRLLGSGDPLPERLARYAARVWQRPSAAAYVHHPRQAAG